MSRLRGNMHLGTVWIIWRRRLLLVIGGLLVSHAFLLWAARHRAHILLRLLVAIGFWCLLWAILLQGELLSQGRVTYGNATSDESTYYHLMAQGPAHFSDVPGTPAPAYLWFGSLTLASAFTQDIFWVRFANILVYTLCCGILYLVLERRLFEQTTGEYVIRLNTAQRTALFAFLASNGIVVWTVIRVLKEPLLCLFLVLACVCIDRQWRPGRISQKFLYMAAFVVLSCLLYFIRQNLTYIVALLWMLALVIALLTRRTSAITRRERFVSYAARVALALLILTLLVAVAYTASDHIHEATTYTQTYEKLYGNYYQDPTSNALKAMGPAGYVVGIARFILGPGPAHALRQVALGDIFVASASTGDVLILLGAIQWWGALLFALYYAARAGSILMLIRTSSDWIAIVVIQVLSYTYVYLGTGDTRHRAVMYIFFSPLFMWLCCIRKLSRRRLALPHQKRLLVARSWGSGRPATAPPVLRRIDSGRLQ